MLVSNASKIPDPLAQCSGVEDPGSSVGDVFDEDGVADARLDIKDALDKALVLRILALGQSLKLLFEFVHVIFIVDAAGQQDSLGSFQHNDFEELHHDRLYVLVRGADVFQDFDSSILQAVVQGDCFLLVVLLVLAEDNTPDEQGLVAPLAPLLVLFVPLFGHFCLHPLLKESAQITFLVAKLPPSGRVELCKEGFSGHDSVPTALLVGRVKLPTVRHH